MTLSLRSRLKTRADKLAERIKQRGEKSCTCAIPTYRELPDGRLVEEHRDGSYTLVPPLKSDGGRCAHCGGSTKDREIAFIEILYSTTWLSEDGTPIPEPWMTQFYSSPGEYANAVKQLWARKAAHREEAKGGSE